MHATLNLSAEALVISRRSDDHFKAFREPMALVRAAVCQAVLARRAEYLSEFDNPNPIRMS